MFTVPDGERAAVFDESLRVLRAALVDDRRLRRPLLHRHRGGGDAATNSPAGHLAGRFGARGVPPDRQLADGWLGSFLTPTEAGAGREAIERAAEKPAARSNPTTTAFRWRSATAG